MDADRGQSQNGTLPISQPLVACHLVCDPRGRTTSAIPYHGGTFEVNFDFIEHNLCICTSV
jgi:hypothetical protein